VSALEQVRECNPVLLAISYGASSFVDENGDPVVFAHSEDIVLEVYEWLTMQGIRLTRDPSEPCEAVIVALTGNWRSSPGVTKAILRAQKARTPLFFLDPRTWQLTSS
jgi:hypothetical protein